MFYNQVFQLEIVSVSSVSGHQLLDTSFPHVPEPPGQGGLFSSLASQGVGDWVWGSQNWHTENQTKKLLRFFPWLCPSESHCPPWEFRWSQRTVWLPPPSSPFDSSLRCRVTRPSHRHRAPHPSAGCRPGETDRSRRDPKKMRWAGNTASWSEGPKAATSRTQSICNPTATKRPTSELCFWLCITRSLFVVESICSNSIKKKIQVSLSSQPTGELPTNAHAKENAFLSTGGTFKN